MRPTTTTKEAVEISRESTGLEVLSHILYEWTMGQDGQTETPSHKIPAQLNHPKSCGKMLYGGIIKKHMINVKARHFITQKHKVKHGDGEASCFGAASLQLGLALQSRCRE